MYIIYIISIFTALCVLTHANRWAFAEQIAPPRNRPAHSTEIYPNTIDHALHNTQWLANNLGRSDQADAVLVLGHHSIDVSCSTYGLSQICDQLREHRVTAYVGGHPVSLKYAVNDHTQFISPTPGLSPEEKRQMKLYAKRGCKDENLLYTKSGIW
jgi:hypothetical protein